MKNLKDSKILMSVTAVALLGAGLVSAQSLTGTVSSTTATGRGVMQNLTDAQKKIMDQARTLFETGDKTAADALLTANGIQIPNKGMNGGRGGNHGNMQAVEKAIIAGDYIAFQTVASTSPLKSIDQATFNSLVPHFTAKKNAEAQIKTILTAAGVQIELKGHKGIHATTTATTTQ